MSKPKPGNDPRLIVKTRGGPPARREATRKIARIVMQNRAIRLKIDGLSYTQIGEALGVSRSMAYASVMEAAGEFLEDTAKQASKYRVIEAERLDKAHRYMVPLLQGELRGRTVVLGEGTPEAKVVDLPADPLSVAKVQLGAVARITNLSARRSALLGLDMPIKVTPTDASGERRYHDLSDEELERMLAQKVTLAGTLPLVANGHHRNGHGPEEE